MRHMKNYIKNERGIAFAMVLVLSVISLAIISTLIYFVIQGTKFSGFAKRYATAREAGLGGTEVADMLIGDRGENLTGLTMTSTTSGGSFLFCDCGDPTVIGDNTPLTCLCRKLCDPTSSWEALCTNSTTLNPAQNYDILFTLDGLETDYDVYGKIVDTTPGNSNTSGLALGGTSVSSSSSSIISAPPLPFLYRVEVVAEDSTNQIERARLSGLYAY
jgi:hypothetical protein